MILIRPNLFMSLSLCIWSSLSIWKFQNNARESSGLGEYKVIHTYLYRAFFEFGLVFGFILDASQISYVSKEIDTKDGSQFSRFTLVPFSCLGKEFMVVHKPSPQRSSSTPIERKEFPKRKEVWGEMQSH